ncbi:uncharacterized protein RCO7_14399 [Rhynchosporium graminicola]|uniref:Uncharacterized protein n=1 Tax=Rhynchosporium graminicola TaxID=2792576 RepID=A0A1E1KDM6_9HELO|nr:uncharacterized protein RCO7_14399 [Rhynchosporium commune]
MARARNRKDGWDVLWLISTSSCVDFGSEGGECGVDLKDAKYGGDNFCRIVSTVIELSLELQDSLQGS